MIHRFLRSLNSRYSAYVSEQFKRLIAGDSIPEDIEAYIEAATSSVWDTRLKSSDHMPIAAFVADTDAKPNKPKRQKSPKPPKPHKVEKAHDATKQPKDKPPKPCPICKEEHWARECPMRKIVAEFVDREMSAHQDTGVEDEVDCDGAYIKSLTCTAVTCLLSKITPAFLKVCY